MIADYHASDDPADLRAAVQRIASMPYESVLEPELLLEVLGFPRGVNPLDTAVSPRGYRALGHVPRLPQNVIRRVVTALEGLEGISQASLRDLETVEGVGSVRAREIQEGLRRLREHNLVERYLNL